MRNVLLSSVGAIAALGLIGVAPAAASGSNIGIAGADSTAEADARALAAAGALAGVYNHLDFDVNLPDWEGFMGKEDCTICDLTKKVDPNEFDNVNITKGMTAGGSVTINKNAPLTELDNGDLTIETNALASTQVNSWSVDADEFDHLGTGGSGKGASSAANRSASETKGDAAVAGSFSYYGRWSGSGSVAGDAAFSHKENSAAESASNYDFTNAAQKIPTFRNAMTNLNVAENATAFGNVNIASAITEKGKGNLSITTNAYAGVQANSISVLSDN